MSDTTRTPRAQMPEFLRSAMMGQLVAAHLSELAGNPPDGNPENPPTATEAATFALLRQASREIADFHEART